MRPARAATPRLLGGPQAVHRLLHDPGGDVLGPPGVALGAARRGAAPRRRAPARRVGRPGRIPRARDRRTQRADDAVDLGTLVVRLGSLPGLRPARDRLPREGARRRSVPVAVSIGGVPAGTLDVLPGDFAEARLALDEAARARMAGAEPVRVELASPVFVARGGRPRRGPACAGGRPRPGRRAVAAPTPS